MAAFIVGLGLVFGMLYSAMPEKPVEPGNLVSVEMGEEKPLVSRSNSINHGELMVKRTTYQGNRTCVLVENRNQSQCLEAKDRAMGVPVLVDSWQKDGAWHLKYADGFTCQISSTELTCSFPE